MRGSNTTTTVDASAGSDVFSIKTLDLLGVLFDAHGTIVVHDLVELLKRNALASDAKNLVLGKRLEANSKRTDIAAEETRNKDGSNKTGDCKDDLNPSSDTAGKKNLGVPKNHPWDVCEKSCSRREDGERRIRSLPVRIIIFKVILSSKFGRSITLRSDVNGPQH